DLFLIAAGPLVLLLLYLMLARTRFGRLIRAATQDREMVGALGVNQALLFTIVFALGSLLAGFAGALQVAREPANLGLDLIVISDAFVVVVVGGMGSITGAFLAALIVAEVKALCIDVLIAVLCATSLHFIMGPGGMHSFGHAAYFGLGAYGAGLMVKFLAAPMPVSFLAAILLALAGALLFGWFAVRLSGVYLA